jgi:titin
LIMPVTASGEVLNIRFQTADGSALDAKVDAIVVGAAQVLSPAAPGNLTATAASSSQINLSWGDSSANETSFQIEVSTDGSTYLPLATVGANVTSYSHVGLSPATTYNYRVRACNVAGCSSYAMTNATTQDAPPAAPGNLIANAQSGSQINLSWADNASNEDGFVIERSLTGATFEQIGTIGANQTSYASTGLKSNTRYYFRVRAFNELGFSAASNTANVRTKAK